MSTLHVLMALLIMAGSCWSVDVESSETLQKRKKKKPQVLILLYSSITNKEWSQEESNPLKLKRKSTVHLNGMQISGARRNENERKKTHIVRVR